MVVKTLKELEKLLGGRLTSPEHADLCVNRIAGLDGVLKESDSAVTFAEDGGSLRKAAERGFKAALISGKLAEELPEGLPALIVENPRIAYAALLSLFYPRRKYKAGIHKSAVIAEDANIDPSVYVGPCAVIESGCTVEPGCEIHAGVYLGRGCRIGSRTRILANASVLEGSSLGKNSLIGPLSVIGPQAELGDDIEMGARCQVSSCKIGAGSRLDNMACIAEGAVLEPLTIIIAQACLQKNVHIGKLAIVTGQSLVDEGRSVGAYATAAARAHVSEDIPEGQNVWSGSPAMPHKAYMRSVIQRQTALKYWEELKKEKNNQ